jgi:hypothetical protein
MEMGKRRVRHRAPDYTFGLGPQGRAADAVNPLSAEVRQARARRSRTISVAAAGEPFTKPKKGPKSRVAEKPVT